MLGLSSHNLFVSGAIGRSWVLILGVALGRQGGTDIAGRVDLLFFGVAKNRTAKPCFHGRVDQLPLGVAKTREKPCFHGRVDQPLLLGVAKNRKQPGFHGRVDHLVIRDAKNRKPHKVNVLVDLQKSVLKMVLYMIFELTVELYKQAKLAQTGTEDQGMMKPVDQKSISRPRVRMMNNRKW